MAILLHSVALLFVAQLGGVSAAYAKFNEGACIWPRVERILMSIFPLHSISFTLMFKGLRSIARFAHQLSIFLVDLFC
jgi:hypothetical protein